MSLSRASHWNQTPRDWQHFLRLSPHGCRGVEVGGRLIGTVATVRYQPNIAWIGMVLVDPAERGHGIGTALLKESLRLLQDVDTVWLDATPAGYGLYRKLGFEEDSRLLRMQSDNPAVTPHDDVLPLTTFEAAATRDYQVFGADRRFHLDWLAEGAPSGAWTLDGGYVFARRGDRFLHIGPIVAPDAATAERLLAACLNHNRGKPAIVDATLRDPEWRARLEGLGFAEQRPFIRMRLGPAGMKQQHPWEYAILGPEFG